MVNMYRSAQKYMDHRIRIVALYYEGLYPPSLEIHVVPISLFIMLQPRLTQWPNEGQGRLPYAVLEFEQRPSCSAKPN